MHSKNTFLFLCMPAALIAGICLGTVASARSDSSALFSAAAESIASSPLCLDSFLKALRQNAIAAALLCIFGTTVLGVLPSAFLLCMRGYAVGKAVGALVASFGFRGFFAAVCGVFPHNLIYVPFLCLLAVHGARFSKRLLFREGKSRGQLTTYLLSSLFLTLPLILGCLVEGYISAPLLKSVLGAHL